MNVMHNAMMVGVMALVTLLLRALPFLLFGGERKTPDMILYLGRVLPYAVMAMLVVYCLKGVSFAAVGSWVPELVAGTAVVLLHLWKRNALLSIGLGTVLYMLLVQLVFV